MRFIAAFLLILFFIDITSCGKLLKAADSEDGNECSFRIVAGRECIVCDKGGVSCKWD